MRALLLALLPAATWAATIYQYEVSVGAAQWGELQFAPWGMSFAAPLPEWDELLETTSASIAGSPYPDAVFEKLWLRNDFEHKDGNFRVFFNSPTIGRILYESWGVPITASTDYLLGHIVGSTFEPGFEAFASIHAPEPSSIILTMSALLWGIRRARRRSGFGCSNPCRWLNYQSRRFDKQVSPHSL